MKGFTTVLVACVLLLAGCAAESDPQDASRNGDGIGGGTLVIALGGEVDSWNPYTTHDATASGILDLLYPRLVHETGSADPATAFDPWLAESWESSPDRLSLTFRLHEGATWSDGTPVTCEDVRFTHQAQISEELAWPAAFIKGPHRDGRLPRRPHGGVSLQRGVRNPDPGRQ